MKLNYHGDVGKLIWAMTTCRPNLAYTSVKLPQLNSCPHYNHYHGLWHALTFGALPCLSTFLKVLSLSLLAIVRISFLMWLAWNLTHIPPIFTPILIGLLVSRPTDLSPVFACTWREVPLHIKQNFSPQLPSPPLRPNSWQLVRLGKWASMYAMYFGTSTFLKKPTLLHTKMTMLALQLPTPKSLYHVHDTWTWSNFLCVIGWNRPSFAWNRSTQKLIWPIPSPKRYNAHLSTVMWISS